MPTAGLTGQGLKRYQRWLAVQRAKGVEPSQSAIQGFLQGEIQANIATDLDRQALSLKRESLKSDIDLRREALQSDVDLRTRRLDLLEKQADRQQGADTIRGITEIIKGAGALNQLSGGLITEGIGKATTGIYDWVSGLGSEGVATSAVDAGMWSGFEDTATEVWDDIADFTGLF